MDGPTAASDATDHAGPLLALAINAAPTPCGLFTTRIHAGRFNGGKDVYLE